MLSLETSEVSNDPGRVPVIRSGRDVLAARADRHPWVFRRVFERIGRAVGAPHIEPEAIALWVGAGRLREARLIHQPEIIPAIIAAVFETGGGGEDLQQVEGAKGQICQLVPQ